MLNGINIVAWKGDLLDRILLIEHQMIPDGTRRSETQLLEELESLTPSILGGILDVLVKAIQILPTIKPSKLYRLSDYTIWELAITEALGFEQQQFLDAYEANIRSQSEETLKASLPATILTQWMDQQTKDTWTGTAAALCDELVEYAETTSYSIKQKGFPKAPHWLIRRLNEVSPSLHNMGYLITHRRTRQARLVTIHKISQNTVTTDNSDTQSDSNDANDRKKQIKLCG